MPNTQIPWNERRVNDFAELNSYVELMINRAHLDMHDVTMIFRGQANSAWTLQPTLLRLLMDPDKLTIKLSIEDIVDLELKSFKNFKQRAHLFHNSSIISNENDIVALITLMQHYGAPTRALDWSISPYVALYYAVSGGFDTDGAIWFFCCWELVKKMEQLYGKEYIPSKENYIKMARDPNVQPIMYISDRDKLTDRMINQQGLFTVCQNVLGDHAYSIGNVLSEFKDIRNWLWKIVIPKEHKIQFLAKLHAMNITGASLFPGADGIGRYLNELMHIESGLNIPEIKAQIKKQFSNENRDI